MNTIEELENELEELKKEFYFFSKDGSSSGGSTPPIKPPTPSDDGWIVIYDMRSTDSAVNLGKTGGIHSYENYIEPIPDLFQYSKIRMTLYADSSTQAFEFDVRPEMDYNGLRMIQHNGIGSRIFTISTSLERQQGKGVLCIARFREIYFAANKYPALTNLTNSDDIARIEKIEVK